MVNILVLETVMWEVNCLYGPCYDPPLGAHVQGPHEVMCWE